MSQVFVRERAERTYHRLCEMLSVDIYIDGVEVWAGSSMQCNLIHNLPV